MNALLKLVGVILILAVAAIIYFVTTSNTTLQPALNSFIAVIENYVKDEDISTSGIDDSNPDGEFVKSLADYYQSRQAQERELSKASNYMMIALTPQNLANSEALAQAERRIAEYNQVAQKAMTVYDEYMSKVISELKKMDDDDTPFMINRTLEDLENKNMAKDKDKIRLRLSLGIFAQQLVEFVKSRNGYFTFENNFLTFSTPQDQQYFVDMVKGINKINQQITDITTAEKRELTESVSKVKR